MSILVLTQPGHAANTWGQYAAEILKADGIAALEVRPLDALEVGAPAPGGADLPDLDAYDAVIVTASLPRRAVVDQLVAYARGGGRLITLRPSRLLATALGLTPTDTVAHPAYVLPDERHAISAGVPHAPIQTHLPADQYEVRALPEGAQEVARLYLDPRTPTAFFAALHFPLDEGQVVVFTYDLAQAVALIRQGDPRLASWRTIGLGQPYRPMDLFTGHVDPRCIHLPQADIHGMLLGNALNAIAKRPPPRWWYYPTPDLRSIVVLDSDDDWSAPEHFDALIEAVEGYGGHVTVYLMLGPTRWTIATPEKVAAWRARGHSFGIHHNAGDPVFGGEEQDAVMEGIIERDLALFGEQYGDGAPLANRNHCLFWKGYVDLPRQYARHGVAMDFNTISIGESWLDYLNGSGRPMRFVDHDGTVLDCFQQLTQAYDDASVKQKLSKDPGGEALKTRGIMEEKVTRYFSPLSMLSHPVSFFTYSSAYMHACWQYARELGMPIWSAFEWAAFVRARDHATIANIAWTGDQFTCAVSGESPRGSLTLMVPLAPATVNGVAGAGGGTVPTAIPTAVPTAVPTATVDGTFAPLTVQQAFGWEYALVPVPLGDGSVRARTVSVALRGGAPVG